MKRFPKVENFIGAQAEDLDENCNHNRYEQEIKNVIDQILVAQFNILELHRVGEIRQDLRHFFWALDFISFVKLNCVQERKSVAKEKK